jgi:hypothetical protein
MERQDAIEPVRRICKWVTEETSDPAMLERVASGRPRMEAVAQ